MAENVNLDELVFGVDRITKAEDFRLDYQYSRFVVYCRDNNVRLVAHLSKGRDVTSHCRLVQQSGVKPHANGFYGEALEDGSGRILGGGDVDISDDAKVVKLSGTSGDYGGLPENVLQALAPKVLEACREHFPSLEEIKIKVDPRAQSARLVRHEGQIYKVDEYGR